MSGMDNPCAEFKLLVHGKNSYGGWVKFTFPGVVPDGFTQWCSRQPHVGMVEGCGWHGEPNTVTVVLTHLQSDTAMRTMIEQIIADAEATLDCRFATQDLGSQDLSPIGEVGTARVIPEPYPIRRFRRRTWRDAVFFAFYRGLTYIPFTPARLWGMLKLTQRAMRP